MNVPAHLPGIGGGQRQLWVPSRRPDAIQATGSIQEPNSAQPKPDIAELRQTLSSHRHSLRFGRSSRAAVPLLKAPNVFNVCFTADGETGCLEPPHAELHSI